MRSSVLRLPTTVPRQEPNFDEAKARLKDYFEITKILKEPRELHDLRRQKASKSIESFACDIKVIEYCAHFKAADPAMPEHILIKQFVNFVNN